VSVTVLNTLSYLKLTEPLWSKPCYLCLWGGKELREDAGGSWGHTVTDQWGAGWEPRHWLHSSFSCKHKPGMEISLIMLEFYFVFDGGAGRGTQTDMASWFCFVKFGHHHWTAHQSHQALSGNPKSFISSLAFSLHWAGTFSWDRASSWVC